MRRKPPALRLHLQPEGRSHDLGRTILILSANSFDIPVRVGTSGRQRGASKPHRAGTCCRSTSGDPGLSGYMSVPLTKPVSCNSYHVGVMPAWKLMVKRELCRKANKYAFQNAFGGCDLVRHRKARLYNQSATL